MPPPSERGGRLLGEVPQALRSTQLLAQIDDLRVKAHMGVALSLCSVVYVAINMVCLVLNGYDMEGGEGAPEPVISVLRFHELEFWATFCFNVVQVLALLYTPKELGELYSSQIFLKLIILVNVGVSFIGALLVTINVEEFEVTAHEMEYANELTMALMDLILLMSLVRNIDGKLWERRNLGSVGSLGLVLLAIAVATIQLCIYNLMGWGDNGQPKGEQLSHYFEFVFESVSAVITFWFTMDNRFVAEGRIKDLLGLPEPPEKVHMGETLSTNSESEDSDA